MHEVLVNRLGGLNLPRKSVVRLTDRPDMTLDVYRGRKTIQQQRLLGTKVVKLLLLLNNDYNNNNRSNDYYIPVSDNTSDKTFRTAITLLRTLSNELNTTFHHPQ